MNEILSFWAQWLRPSAGLPTVQWSLLLAVAATGLVMALWLVLMTAIVWSTLDGAEQGAVGAVLAPRMALLARAEAVQDRWGLPAVKWLKLFKPVAG